MSDDEILLLINLYDGPVANARRVIAARDAELRKQEAALKAIAEHHLSAARGVRRSYRATANVAIKASEITDYHAERRDFALKALKGSKL